MGCELGKFLLVLLVGNLVGWKLGKMEDSLGSSHLEGELLVADCLCNDHTRVDFA